MQSVVCIVGMTLIIVLYLLGYFIMFKAKDNTKVLVTGALTVFSGIVVGITTLIIGLALKEDDSPKQEDTSQVETRDELIVKIPYNFDGGFLITEDGEHRVYVGGIDNIKETSEENIKEEK